MADEKEKKMADEKEKKIEKPQHSQPPTKDAGVELTEAECEGVAGNSLAGLTMALAVAQSGNLPPED